MAIDPVRGISFGSSKTHLDALADKLTTEGKYAQEQAEKEKEKARLLARQNKLDGRADIEWGQKQDAVAKKLAADRALVEYASNPFDTSKALGSQRALADNALLEDSANRLAKYEASLKKYNVTQDDVNKGRVSQDILGKIANPGLDSDTALSASNVYSNMTPFREDVMATVKSDLIAKGVDPLVAAQYAKTEATQYESIPEYQKILNQKAKDKTTASKDNAEWNLKVAKLTKDILKDAKSGTSSDAGINKLYEQARASGNPDAATTLIDTAIKDGYSAKQIAREFARGGVGAESNFWNLKDWGKVDARVDEVMGRLAKEDKKGNFVSKSLGDYSKMLTTPQTYSAADARRKSQTDARDSMLEALGITKPVKAAITKSDTSESKEPKVTGSSNGGGATTSSTKQNGGGIFYPSGTKKGEYPEDALKRDKIDWSKEPDDQLLVSLEALTKKNDNDGVFGWQINRLIDEIESRGDEDLSHLRVESTKQEEPSGLTKVMNKDLPKDEKDIKKEEEEVVVKAYEFAKADREKTNGGFFDDHMTKTRLKTTFGLSDKKAEGIMERLKSEKRQQDLTSHRNYLTSKRNGGTFEGKTTDEHFDSMSDSGKASVFAPVAPIVAATVPFAGLVGALTGTSAATVGIEGTSLAGTAGRKLLEKGYTKNVKDQLAGLEKNIEQVTSKINRIFTKKKLTKRDEAELNALELERMNFKRALNNIK